MKCDSCGLLNNKPEKWLSKEMKTFFCSNCGHIITFKGTHDAKSEIGNGCCLKDSNDIKLKDKEELRNED